MITLKVTKIYFFSRLSKFREAVLFLLMILFRCRIQGEKKRKKLNFLYCFENVEEK
jgi:hypothetical protein